MNLHYTVPQRLSVPIREQLPLAVNGMGMLILVIIGRVQEFIPGITKLSLAKVLFICMAVLVGMSRRLEQDRPFSHPQIKAFVLLFALGGVSVVTSRWPGESWRFMSVDFLSVGIFVFFLIKVCISWRALWRICWSLVAAAAILSFTTLAMYESGRATIVGTAYDPNDLAFLLVVVLPFFYFMARIIEGKVLRLLLIVGLIALIVTIIITQSRGGFIGLLVVSSAILMHEKVRPMPVVLVGCTLFLLFSVYAPEGYWDRISDMGKRDQDYNMTAVSGRLEIWKRGIGFMFENPVLGVGPNAFGIADGESRGGQGKWSTAHNSFVLIGAELGVTGLILFLWMIATSLATVRSVRHKLPPGAPEAGLLRAIEVGFYGYSASGFFLSQAYDPVLYLLVGLSVVAANLIRKANNETVHTAVMQPTGKAGACQ